MQCNKIKNYRHVLYIKDHIAMSTIAVWQGSLSRRHLFCWSCFTKFRLDEKYSIKVEKFIIHQHSYWPRLNVVRWVYENQQKKKWNSILDRSNQHQSGSKLLTNIDWFCCLIIEHWLIISHYYTQSPNACTAMYQTIKSCPHQYRWFCCTI